MTELEGNIVDVLDGDIFQGVITMEQGKITDIKRKKVSSGRYVLPGFIDSHIHIESTKLPPSEFSRTAVKHGTVAAVSDPHEIANVLGVEGIRFMIVEGERTPLKFFFGAPSCVPSTPYETSGAEVSANEIETLFERKRCAFLGEVMDYVGVVNGDEELIKKIDTAHRYGVKVDGHAPGLRGDDLKKYIEAGISTDHECTGRGEAVEKLEKGMKIQIREGSAAKDFDELVELIEDHPKRCMLCTDDIHVQDLTRGHIDELVKRAVEEGLDPFKVLRTACVNPVQHYGLDVGLLKEGDPADLVVVNDLREFEVRKTFIDGELVYDAEVGVSFQREKKSRKINRFKARKLRTPELALERKGKNIRVITVHDKKLRTGQIVEEPRVDDGKVVADAERDVLKLVVVNRYEEGASPALGFVHNFGLNEGALASSVLHDSHNIAAVGTDDLSIERAVNAVIEERGGLAAVSDSEQKILPLPIAGLMSDRSTEEVEKRYSELRKEAVSMGCELSSPFMTLSFLSLLVVPELKMSDRGLFDVHRSRFVSVFTDITT